MDVNNILVQQDVDIGIAQMSESYSIIKVAKNVVEVSDELTKDSLSGGIFVDNETGEMMHGSGGEAISFMEIEDYFLNPESDSLSSRSDSSHPILHSILTKSESNELKDLRLKNESEIKPETGHKPSDKSADNLHTENVPYTPCEGAEGNQTSPDSTALDKATEQFKEKTLSVSLDKSVNCSNRGRSKDEKRARALNIPFTMAQIINSPVDEFNDLITNHSLNEAQLQLIKDIRRRGKNKMAAQSCRKRKMDAIGTLESEVLELRDKCKSLTNEQEELRHEVNTCENKINEMYSMVFDFLPKPSGGSNNIDDYTLEQTKDGRLFLVPK
ncbi:DgyrCDS14307 [Dimorphilus gyrociliatus]|uniref:DgyrCDS14307 n=1 Tax=Dimorphilus gyrociliatus TaxID=2664684 RepID=A0A7I8WD85_9ANNE|nr:DgyrCDS14307 [Dimorphilus gyrociliatus]